MKTKAILSLLIGFTLFFNACKKDETVPVAATFDGGEVSGTWTKNGTYTITGHIIIPEGKSLTIEEGATVIFADTSLATEFLVYGNLYCNGTATNPITFTVPEELRTTENAMVGLWGGILADSTCEEILLNYTTIEYAGALTTESSPSVQRGLYKGTSGERLPILWTSNTSGRYVITNCTFRNFAEDGFYLEGGSFIISNNTFHTSGLTGGEAVNVKSGCLVDASYNLFYSPNTNAFKLSNADSREPQATVYAYNNTILNAGWRRPSVKGGSIWIETNVKAFLYDNMIANCRFGIKNSSADASSIYDYNYYYGYDQTCVDQFQTTTSKVVRGTHDIGGTTAGENDPLFINYPLSTDMNNSAFDDTWNFHVGSSSPALNAGTTNFTRTFGTSGISVNGIIYTSPAPSVNIGAFGTN
jgi:hypothetical protein